MILNDKLLQLISLDGKVAVISGGASGIGLGTAKRLSEFNANVAILDINDENGQNAVKEIEKLNGQAIYIHCDVRSKNECKNAIDNVMEKFGQIDILFNNAGVAVRKNTVNLEEEEWDLALDVTLKGIYMLSHFAIPHMTKNGGSIINTGSGWSLRGGADAISYCAAKGGVLNLTRAMAIDHGKNRIRVNCVCPGDIDTPMLRSECDQLGENENAFMEDAADRPIHRVGTPEDVANAVLFFASDLSTWVTGAHLVVDGGGIAS